MKLTLDTISFSVIAAAAAGSAMVAITGDSAVIRSAGDPLSPRLLAMWAKAQTAGTVQLVSPFMHDTTRAIRSRNIIATPQNIIPVGLTQPMKSQDQLSATFAATAVAGDVELLSVLMAYPDLGGGSEKYISAEECSSRYEAIVTIEDTLTATVASTYSGARALNTVTTSLKANRDYAVLGGLVSVVAGALSIRGQDTGNLRASIPCNPTGAQETRNFFYDLASWSGLPTIPVVNAANQSGTFIELLQDENLVAVPFTLFLALLKE